MENETEVKEKAMGASGSTLSVCMIVKDEEDFIAQCLDSIKHIADEIIIVDTGSTDRTREIVEEYGKAGFNIKLYLQEWQDDFSYHRNQSISKATCEWILQIDADEVITFGDMPFKNHLATLKDEIKGLAFEMVDMKHGKEVCKWNAVRCFRNGFIKFKNKVHNVPEVGGLIGFYKYAYFRHYGYDLSEEKMKIKNERRERLLLERYEEDKEDWEAIFYLLNHYIVTDNIPAALRFGDIYLEGINLNVDFKISAYYSLVIMALDNGMFEYAKEILNSGLTICSWEDLDLCYALIEFGVKTNDVGLILKGAEKYLERFEEQQRIHKGNCFSFTSTYVHLSYALYHQAICKLQDAVNSALNLKKLIDEPKLLPEGFGEELYLSFGKDVQNLGISFVKNESKE